MDEQIEEIKHDSETAANAEWNVRQGVSLEGCEEVEDDSQVVSLTPDGEDMCGNPTILMLIDKMGQTRLSAFNVYNLTAWQSLVRGRRSRAFRRVCCIMQHTNILGVHMLTC